MLLEKPLTADALPLAARGSLRPDTVFCRVYKKAEQIAKPLAPRKIDYFHRFLGV
jgi:hypothetical protein